VQGAIRAIAERFTGRGVDVDQAVYNAARIFKVYGTTARKGHHMADRPHRLARLVDVPSTVQVVTHAKLEALAATVAKPTAVPSASGHGHEQSFTNRLDVPRWLAARGVSFKVKDRPTSDGRTIYLLEQCPFDSGHGGHGETSIMQGPDGKLGAACMHNSCTGRGWQEFKAAIGPPDAEHWDPPLSDHRNNGTATEARHHGDGDGPKEPRFKCYSMAELDSMNLSVDYLFRGALVADTPGVIGGREKTLKTSIAFDLGVSMASFTPWLGQFEPVRSARVVYFLGEGGLTFGRDCARRVAENKGLKLADVQGFYLCDQVPNLDNDLAVRDATQLLVDHEAQVGIFDPFYLMLAHEGGNASSVFAMGAILRRMLEACRAAGAWPIVCHHFRKCQPIGQSPELSDLSQAGLAEFAGQWLLINRQRAYDEEQPGEHDLIVKLGSRLGFGSKWAMHVSEGKPDGSCGRFWRPELTTYAEARKTNKAARDEERRAEKAAALEADRHEIIATAVKLKSPETQTGLRDLVCARGTMGHTRFDRAFVTLTADNTLEKVGGVEKGTRKNLTGWRVRNDLQT
jgi:hypothetical protein